MGLPVRAARKGLADLVLRRVDQVLLNRLADGLRLDGDLAAPLSSPAGFDDARAAGMLLYVADDAGGRLALARDLLERDRADGVRAGATAVDRVLLLRWLGRDARAVRTAVGRFWSAFRVAALGRPSRLPTLWQI